MKNLRARAATLITEVIQNGRSLATLLPSLKNQYKDARDRALIQEFCFGVLRYYPCLVFIANRLLQKPLKEKDRDLLNLICVGLYQLRETRIPEHAVLSDTVEGVVALKKPWGKALVNAVLRSYQRQKETLQKEIEADCEAKYAHPAWLFNLIKTAWPMEYENILAANNKKPPLTLRVNSQKCTRQQFLDNLQALNIEAVLLPETETGVMLSTPQDITTLPGYAEGHFSVQDSAAQFAAGLLLLQPNFRVLDACSAPGGKTTHLLELEPALRELVAIDNDPARTKLIQENLTRLQLKACVKTADALKPTAWWDGKQFDRILLDAPCSATGVIRRHPDIKYCRHAEDINKLANQQMALLESLWPLLKPHGILLYVTCSILPTENQDVMEHFLKRHSDAKLFPFSLPQGVQTPYGVQLLPGQNNGDGFYYARIIKH